ncbi:Arm DNA-binding domain-containing protein [Brevibacillus porteri]
MRLNTLLLLFVRERITKRGFRTKKEAVKAMV